MPIKRSPEETSRPPLSRGSACHRCFSRKVRCSGQPAPGSGVFACTSCLRTARFKGHELSQARSPRRKTASRSTTTSSISSVRSATSATSQATDYSFDSSAPSLISPVSSTASLKSLGEGVRSTGSSPENMQLPPTVPYQYAAAVPQYGMPPGFAPTYGAAPLYPSTSSVSLPTTPLQYSSAFPGAPAQGADPLGPKSLLSRRAKAAPMSISLPPQPAMALSPAVSRAPSPAAASTSAPLAHPVSWGAPAQQSTLAGYAGPLPAHNSTAMRAPLQAQQPLHHPPPPQDDLTGALQAVLTPSTLSKLPGTSSYDFSLAPDAFPPYLSGAPATPSFGVAPGSGASTCVGMGAVTGQSALPPTPLRSLSVSELYPPSVYGGGGVPTPHGLDAANAAVWSGSFHLPSPGLTFSSSTPHWLSQSGASQYFQS
ncbi:uncharacterized protein JCM10292_007111 [Rhodotorula paludigena]|uniref:uncharacterized protein n=1 Tax=Rhodotorula paludigena TaxID=86838 RepID=UPI00316EAA98